MGSGASLLDNIDQETFRTFAAEHYSDEIFNAFKNSDGFISKEKVLGLQAVMENTKKLRTQWNLSLQNGATHISVAELAELIKAAGFEPDEHDLADPNNDRTISFLEFLSIMRSKITSHALEKEILETFKVFDLNGDGFISVEELKEVMNDMGENVSDIEAAEMVKEADENLDGKLSLKEYTAKMVNYVEVNPDTLTRELSVENDKAC